MNIELEMDPDPARAYFWPADNKRQTQQMADLTRVKIFDPDPSLEHSAKEMSVSFFQKLTFHKIFFHDIKYWISLLFPF